MAMYKLNEHYQDKFSLYVYFNDELKSLDEWIRETDLSGSFYFGGTLDYAESVAKRLKSALPGSAKYYQIIRRTEL